MMLTLVSVICVSPTVAQTREVVDGQGKSVAVKSDVTRVISLAPSLTEMVFDLGAERRLVGAIAYDDHPPGARDILSVGTVAGLDYERVLKLKPQLILAWLGGTPTPWIDRLRELGLTVYVSRTQTLKDIGESMTKIATLLGVDARARVNQYNKRLEQLTDRYRQRAAVRVFYQVWAKPLMSLNRDHIISNALQTCGATNIFEDVSSLVPRVNAEAVLAKNPQVIATAIAGGFVSGKPTGLERWSAFPTLPAVKNQHLVVLDANQITRPSVRILDAVDQLCIGIDDARLR